MLKTISQITIIGHYSEATRVSIVVGDQSFPLYSSIFIHKPGGHWSIRALWMNMDEYREFIHILTFIHQWLSRSSQFPSNGFPFGSTVAQVESTRINLWNLWNLQPWLVVDSWLRAAGPYPRLVLGAVRGLPREVANQHLKADERINGS